MDAGPSWGGAPATWLFLARRTAGVPSSGRIVERLWSALPYLCGFDNPSKHLNRFIICGFSAISSQYWY
ncbi:hypothetical protein JB92DRAFT_2844522 [Gautieria morchelliformis]|nr:hypothetical protein JB92DRAFT_2844522 [Gautieria morchelliformis]